MATESLTKAVKEENGQKVPLWSRDEIDQIVISQVRDSIQTLAT